MVKKKHTPRHKEMSFNRSLLPKEWQTRQDILPVNRANWSLSSQNSYSCPSVYQSYSYLCSVCQAKCLFTAQEQKHAYEVEKRHIDQRRIYCETCYQRLNIILNELYQAKKQWGENKRELEKDATFLENWLALFNELTQFRSRIDWMLREMVEKRLQKLSN